jgi:hypothetical protein
VLLAPFPIRANPGRTLPHQAPPCLTRPHWLIMARPIIIPRSVNFVKSIDCLFFMNIRFSESVANLEEMLCVSGRSDRETEFCSLGLLFAAAVAGDVTINYLFIRKNIDNVSFDLAKLVLAIPQFLGEFYLSRLWSSLSWLICIMILFIINRTKG